MMIRILGISGSLRARSYDTALLRAASTLAAPAAKIDIATLHGIPLYDGDLEQRQACRRPQVWHDSVAERVAAGANDFGDALLDGRALARVARGPGVR
jgi:NAD(P)H-dependent FMN reductase